MLNNQRSRCSVFRVQGSVAPLAQKPPDGTSMRQSNFAPRITLMARIIQNMTGLVFILSVLSVSSVVKIFRLGVMAAQVFKGVSDQVSGINPLIMHELLIPEN